MPLCQAPWHEKKDFYNNERRTRGGENELLSQRKGGKEGDLNSIIHQHSAERSGEINRDGERRGRLIIHTLALFISQLHCRNTYANTALQDNENENMSKLHRQKGNVEEAKDMPFALLNNH